MIKRNLNLPKNHSFLLFGARGTGKSTLLKQHKHLKQGLWLDFLNPDVEEEYARQPQLLRKQVAALRKNSWVVIDEVQKIPKILDLAHSLIESTDIKFALSGSSSRKLKAGGANLLAGRAFVFSLFPLTHYELGTKFDLDAALHWGTLPKIFDLASEKDKARYLRSYQQLYLKEEILQEQLVKKIDPFRLFLPIAAQMNAEIINYSNIARDTGVDYKTIQTYYQILVDTYLGHFLEPYGRSVRKVQIQAPKFYFFDTGVKRSLENVLRIPVTSKSDEYGDLFETWFINECMRMNHYLELDYSFSYLRTKDDVEVDLIIDRPGEKQVLLEIKSAEVIDDRHLKSLQSFKPDFPKAEFICAAKVKYAEKVEGIWVLPWKDALKVIGLGK